MVTAGIFMVARMSPLFELSPAAQSFVIVIGAITMFFMALIALVQYDIKRVVAYSTLSQLGVHDGGARRRRLLGGHFPPHDPRFFKAVLFLGAGSVIIALHHEQDMRKMGGLRKYMPITYWTVFIGALANAGIRRSPGSSPRRPSSRRRSFPRRRGTCSPMCWRSPGIRERLYSFRLVFFAFHGKERFLEASHHAGHADARTTVGTPKARPMRRRAASRRDAWATA